MENVYQCVCGLWSRQKMTILKDNTAVCLCGKEMQLAQRDIKPLKNKILSFEQELKEIWAKNREPIQRHGHKFWDKYAGGFVPGCRKGENIVYD